MATPRPYPLHESDHDGVCIHCGHDGAEEHHLRTHGHADLERTPCPVWNEDTRAENRRRYPIDDPYDISEYDMLDAEQPDW